MVVGMEVKDEILYNHSYFNVTLSYDHCNLFLYYTHRSFVCSSVYVYLHLSLVIHLKTISVDALHDIVHNVV